MNKRDVGEAVAVLGTVLDLLLASVPGHIGQPGAQLRQTVGDLRASGEADIRAGSLGAPLFACFDGARAAGTDRAGFGRILGVLTGMTPAGTGAIAIMLAGIRFCLIEQAQIVTATTFTSREDTDALMVTMSAAFADAEETAADDLDSATYRALVTLHASVTRDLADRARPLPQIVAYAFAISLPALALSNRIYADGARFLELRDENKAVHPAFMPAAGRALSA